MWKCENNRRPKDINRLVWLSHTSCLHLIHAQRFTRLRYFALANEQQLTFRRSFLLLSDIDAGSMNIKMYLKHSAPKLLRSQYVFFPEVSLYILYIFN